MNIEYTKNGVTLSNHGSELHLDDVHGVKLIKEVVAEKKGFRVLWGCDVTGCSCQRIRSSLLGTPLQSCDSWQYYGDE